MYVKPELHADVWHTRVELPVSSRSQCSRTLSLPSRRRPVALVCSAALGWDSGGIIDSSLRSVTPVNQVDMHRWVAPKVDVKAWTDMIMGSKTPAELQRCLSGLQQWNKFHLTAAFSKLASFSRGPAAHATRPAAIRLLPSLISRAREHLPRLQARSLASVVHCIGTYEHQDMEVMAEIAKAAEENIRDFTSQGLSNLLWGFARVDMQPTHRWMDAYLGACQARLADFEPQEMSIILWSLAKLKYRLTPGKLHDFLQHVNTRLTAYSPHSISNVLWSLGTADQRPDEAWLQAVAQEIVRPEKLSGFSAQGLSQAMWALAIMRYHPGEEFKEQVQPRVKALLPKCNAIDVATFMYAYAAMRMSCDADMVRKLQASSYNSMQSLQPSHMAKIVWAFAKLGAVPSKPWLFKLLTMAFQSIDTFNARDLAMFAWGLAKLGVMLPSSFLGPFVQRIEFMAAEFPPQEVANTIWSLACFNVRPSSVLLAQFFEATDKRLSSFKPMELSQMIWALSDRHCLLEKTWVQEFLKVSFLRMPDFSPQALANIVWALARLHIVPPPAWLYSYVKVCRQQLSEERLKPLDLGTIINGLSSLNEGKKLDNVNAFVVDAMDAIAGIELKSQAYTRQQLNYFMHLRPSRVLQEAGRVSTAAAAAPVVGPPEVLKQQQERPLQQHQEQADTQHSEQQHQQHSDPAAAGPGPQASPKPEIDAHQLNEYLSKLQRLRSHKPGKSRGLAKSASADGNFAGVLPLHTSAVSTAEHREGVAEEQSQQHQEEEQHHQQHKHSQLQRHTGQVSVHGPAVPVHLDLPDLHLELGAHGSAISGCKPGDQDSTSSKGGRSSKKGLAGVGALG